ncbi:MAG TPA: hypothetical protein VF487_03355 [Chitinophagaceae bacterium]
MRKQPILLLVTFICLLSLKANSQADTTAIKNKAQFRLGIYYNNNLNYYGRTDSLQSSGVFPLAELWFGKGFYLTAAPVFVNNKVSKFEYAGTVATLGYQHSSEKKLLTNIFLVKPIYKDNSQLVQSALKAQFTSNFTWMNKVINMTAGADLKLSDNLDYGVTGGLDHIFRFQPGNGFVIVVDPSAYIYAGTQRFSKTYYKRSNFIFFPGTEQQITENVNQFNILSYEFSMPIVLAKGKLQLIANPAYVIPRNLVVVEGRPDLSERGKETFYVTAGAKYNF